MTLFNYKLFIKIIILLLFYSSPCFAEQTGCLSNEPVTIIIRNDDVCALSNATWEKKIVDIFIQNNIAQSVGFIPNIASTRHHDSKAEYYTINQNKEILDLYVPLIKEGIIDPIQHGVTHQNNYLHAGDITPLHSSEFIGLSAKKQRQTLIFGKQLLEKHLKHDINIFIPPWNNLDKNTITALNQAGIKGVSDYHLYRTDDLHISSEPSRIIDFYELPEILNKWKNEGQCMGNLKPQTIVILYHSWTEYSEEGLQRIKTSLELIKQSGVNIETLNQAFQINNN